MDTTTKTPILILRKIAGSTTKTPILITTKTPILILRKIACAEHSQINSTIYQSAHLLLQTILKYSIMSEIQTIPLKIKHQKSQTAV